MAVLGGTTGVAHHSAVVDNQQTQLEVSTTAEMDASPTAGDGEKLDMLINMVSKMNEKIELIDSRVKDLETDSENETVAIKSEYSDKERNMKST